LELEELIKKTNDAGHQERPTAPNEDTKATALARVERLTAAHAEAVAEIERIRKQLGQLTTGINGEVGSSILEAGVRALADVSDDEEPKQFVVAAPPGTGKTSPCFSTVKTPDAHPTTCAV
jgi:anti-sigma factor RsiW